MTSKPIEQLNDGVLVDPAPEDLFHIAQSAGGGTYNSRATSIAKLVALIGQLAPEALNSIDELAAAINDDENFATTIINLVTTKAPLLLTIENEASDNYSFVLADAHKHKRFTAAGAVTLTVPTNATVPIPIGTRIRITAAGAGGTTLVPAFGVTLNSRDGALLSGGHMAVFEIEKVAADEWDCLGDLIA